MKKISLVLVLMSTMFSFSQSEFQIELNLGYAFQREMILNDENLDNKSAFGLQSQMQGGTLGVPLAIFS